MNESKKCLSKKYIIIIYTLIITLYSILLRKYKEVSMEYPLDISIINTFTLYFISKLIILIKHKPRINYLSFFFLRAHVGKRDNYSALAVLVCASLYLAFEFIYRRNFSKLTSVVVCIFSQSRVILIFLFSIVFLHSKTNFLQLIGIILIIFSNVLGCIKNESKSLNFSAAVLISVGSALNGLSACLFDYWIKNKVTDFLFYLSDFNYINLLLVLLIKFCVSIQNLDKFLIVNLKILLISFLSSLVALVAVASSMYFIPMERILLNIVASAFRDIVTDIVHENSNDYIKVISYCICVLGVITYKGKELLLYFKKM